MEIIELHVEKENIIILYSYLFFCLYYSNQATPINDAVNSLLVDDRPGINQAFNSIMWNGSLIADLQRVIDAAQMELTYCADDLVCTKQKADCTVFIIIIKWLGTSCIPVNGCLLYQKSSLECHFSHLSSSSLA